MFVASFTNSAHVCANTHRNFDGATKDIVVCGVKCTAEIVRTYSTKTELRPEGEVKICLHHCKAKLIIKDDIKDIPLENLVQLTGQADAVLKELEPQMAPESLKRKATPRDHEESPAYKKFQPNK